MPNLGQYSKLSQDSPDKPINQRKIIDSLNGYLSWHHFPIHVNSTGTCKGLSTVYAKYVLEGRKKEFIDMLYKISSDLQPNSEHDNFLNHFAVEVVLTQLPTQYENTLTQKTSIQCLEIEGSRLHASFDFSMSTKDENWAKLIAELDLKENEPMLLNTATHCVCVTKEHGKYCVYDPNYEEGIRFYEDETAVINELRFYQNLKTPNDQVPDKFLDLGISVIRHPTLKGQRLPEFPTELSLYEKYLPTGSMNNIEYIKVLNKNLYHAQDKDSINKLVALGATDFEEAVIQAIDYQNTDKLCILLPKITNHECISKFIKLALESGSENTVSILSRYNIEYERLICMENIQDSVRSAAFGKNHKIIEKLLSDAKNMLLQQSACDTATTDQYQEVNEQITMNVFKNLYGESDPITAAILGGDANCVRTLIAFINLSSSVVVSEEKRMGYLLLAIKENQSSVVNYLITQVSPETIKQVLINPEMAEKTELSILHQLKQHGMLFSPASLVIMMEKEHQVIPLTLKINMKIEIILRKYTDFIHFFMSPMNKLGSIIYARMFNSSDKKCTTEEKKSMHESYKTRKKPF